MYALLGEVQLDLITYFDGYESYFAADYAEHALIEGKPRLQFIGDALDEIRIRLKLHAHFCDPEAEMLTLREALAAHEAMALVLGNGDYKGWFVIAELSCVSEQTDAAGTLIALEANLTLKEFVGDKKNPLPPPAIKTEQTPVAAVDKAAPVASAIPASPAALSGLPTAPATLAAEVVASANAASAALASAFDLANAAQALVGNPALLFNAQPGLSNALDAAAAPLLNLASALNTLAPPWLGLASLDAVLAPVAQSLACVQNAQALIGQANALIPVAPQNTFAAVANQVAASRTALDSAAAPLSQLAARVVTRSL